MTKKTFQVFPTIESIASPFDGILLDAYGVFWGGNAFGPLLGSQDMMRKLVAQNKVVGVLSNSTQLSAKEMDKLEKHGFRLGEHFHFLLTSGEIARHIFSVGSLPFATPKKKYYLFGKPHPKFSSHETLFQMSSYTETQDISQADFIFVAIPHIGGEDQTDLSFFRKEVQELQNSKLPMVCANPDLYAHEGNPPKAVVRQGSIAALYEEIGGEVYYVGKPSDTAYLYAMEKFIGHHISDPRKILMVGDTPETDIRGAKKFGMSSALLTKTGIMADRIDKHGFELAVSSLSVADTPDFFVERLGAL